MRRRWGPAAGDEQGAQGSLGSVRVHGGTTEIEEQAVGVLGSTVLWRSALNSLSCGRHTRSLGTLAALAIPEGLDRI